MKRVGVTGANGFVGKNLFDYLQSEDFKLQPILRKELLEVKVEMFHQMDCIVHLAGKAHDLKKSSDPAVYYDVNYELTKQLYDAFLKSNAKKFIFISSVKAAADSVQGILIERTTPNPQTDYGKSKLMAEQYIQAQPLPEGKSYFILRPCMIHGPNNKGNLNLLYQFVKKGIPYPLAAFENKRSFLSVDNLCFVIKTIMEQDSFASGLYQVADDEPLSTSEVVTILADSLGKKPKLWGIPALFIEFAAKVGDRLKLPLNTERLQKLTESYVVSNEKMKTELHLKMPLSSREGLKLTADSFKEST